MKKINKIALLLILALMMTMIASPVFASTDTLPSATSDISATNPTNTEGVLNIAGKVLGFMRWIAVIGGALVIGFLGLKYMMGSLEEKAEYKKSFMPLIVGVVVVMAAAQIADLLVNTFSA